MINPETKELEHPERAENAARILDDYLTLKEDEKVLFLITEDEKDTDRELIGILKGELSKRGIDFSELIANNQTTQEEILLAAKECNLIWNSWSMEDTEESVSFDGITEFLEENDKRMAFCPGAQAEFLDEGGCLTENIETMQERLSRMESMLKDATGFKINSSYGTDLRMKLKKGDRKWYKDDGVIKDGSWDNLPGGEIFTTPDEESVEGVLVLPVLQDEVAIDQGVDEFVRLTFHKGQVVKIDGGASAEKLRTYLIENSANAKDFQNVVRIAEIAFGANSKAKTVVSDPEKGWQTPGRPTIETEKRLGTMHLALGGSGHGEEGTEGHSKSTENEVHLDFVIPRNGLTVEMFTTARDYEKQKNGRKLINQGSWNFY
ncbi:MAG: aminopeptidase [Candidatus Staskawiczbacteria bacterium]|nr:aminopeptidase [Candidatus Staskawiczbacteria bacterium]